MIEVKIKTKGFIPQYARPGDAGCDLQYFGDCIKTLQPGKTGLFPTGIILEIPEGYEGVVSPRSGLSLKGITAAVGTIDSGYRGEIGVILTNHSRRVFYINPGDRIAQLKFYKVEQAMFSGVSELSQTERGDGGFGHTGVSI